MFGTIDKLKIVLYVTWVWAWTGLYITKMLETGFKLILLMPNSWLAIPASMCQDIETKTKKKISVLHATTTAGNVTNKFKLFLKYYWEQSTNESAFDANGFSMRKAREFLNCSLLYCSYIISDPAGTIPAKIFLKNVRYIMLHHVDGQTSTSDNDNVFLDHITFENEPVTDISLRLSDLELDT